MLYEGQNRSDNSAVTEFTQLNKALAEYEDTPYSFALIMEYEGTKEDPLQTYIQTIAEKGG